MIIYFLGALFAIYIIIDMLPNGWADVVRFAEPDDKFQVINFTIQEKLSLTEFFTGGIGIIGGIIGGAFLSMASHGTDQMIVQRLLTCKDKRSSQMAIIFSGLIVFLQFAIFLIIGVMLYAFYEGLPFKEMFVQNHALTKPDEIFPKFIIEQLPVGVVGIVVSGLLAASMSTLSSTFNALSSATILDLFGDKFSGNSEETKLKYSKLATLFWAIVIISTGMLFQSETNPAVDYALKIQSMIYGGLLGVFLLGMFNKDARAVDAAVSYSVSIVILVLLFLLPKFGLIPELNLTWFTMFGVIIVFLVSFVTEIFGRSPESNSTLK